MAELAEAGKGLEAREMLFQENDEGKGQSLKWNYLYLDTFTMKDQTVNSIYLSIVCKVPRPLMPYTNAGLSSTNYKGYLGSHPFWLDHFGI